MAISNLSLLITLFISISHIFAATQNCDCDDGLCCSSFGYCGIGNEYCGEGCQSGPCRSSDRTANENNKGPHLVANIVTESFFDNLIGQADSNCEGKGFYTREAFLTASESYSSFAQHDSLDNSKREIAAFFATISHETQLAVLCYKEEREKSNYCDEKNFPQYPCASEKKYYGRGPLQITWNYNYGPAGEEIGFDGLNSPEISISDATISFKTALWYWVNKVHGDAEQGFGAVIRAVNGALECDGKEQLRVFNRVDLYLSYCKMFDVTPGDNIMC